MKDNTLDWKDLQDLATLGGGQAVAVTLILYPDGRMDLWSWQRVTGDSAGGGTS